MLTPITTLHGPPPLSQDDMLAAVLKTAMAFSIESAGLSCKDNVQCYFCCSLTGLSASCQVRRAIRITHAPFVQLE